ncbi:MAG TPA: TlpA disulfide reductase family protein [Burkholderiales bacterium]
MRPGRRKALALGAVAAAAAVGGAFVGALVVQSGSGAARLLSASFLDLEGRTRRLREWRGQVLVCNFWATWCAPCREEVPLLVAATQHYAGKGLKIIGIAIDHADNIRDFAINYLINYQMLVGGSETIEIMRDLGNKATALPYTVLLDRSGRLAGQRLGAFRKEELAQVLMGLLR